MFESAAICIRLCEIHGLNELWPDINSPERHRVLQWMSFLSAEFYTTCCHCYNPEHYTSDQSKHGLAAVVAAATSTIESHCRLVSEHALGDQPFISGEKAGLADIYLTMILGWMPDCVERLKRYPELQALAQHVLEIPKVYRAFDDHQSTLKQDLS